MKPTELLSQEHRIIEIVLACLDRMVANCEAGHPLDLQAASQAIEFFQKFADDCHHGKEEALLFPMMEERGFLPDQGPTGVMRQEHELGRRRVRGMADALKEFSLGDLAGKLLFVEHAREFSALLRQHIQKEDHCLFRMADQALSPADQIELQRQFEQADRERFGADARDRYWQQAIALADRLGVAIAAASPPCGNACSSE